MDKTPFIYNLLNGAGYYFLSRPRRFGKSLLLDTIGEAFGGDKELFKGLWIYDSDYSFAKHPVIRLDMSNISGKTPEALEAALLYDLKIKIKDEGLNIIDSEPSNVFKSLILEMHKKYGQRIVILVDEYDKPILDHINNVKTASANRQALREFYGILKSMDSYLRLVIITGVSKFAKTSIFSGINNLQDISLSEDYANICGIPVESLDEYFHEYIEKMIMLKRFEQYDNIRDEILSWYDGYTWDGETKLLNPFSLLNFFDQKRFAGFWYASGTPGFLLDLIKKKPESYMNIRNTEITEYMLDFVDIDKITIEPLLFQTGYLTIKDIPPTIGTPVYILDMPNFEVREAFNLHVLSALTETDDIRAWRMQSVIKKSLRDGDVKKMLDIMRGFFASIPYELHVDAEAYYHSIFYTFMTLLGFEIDVEVSVSKGRVDAICEFDDKVYVMEFKYAKCPPGASDEEKRITFEKTLDDAMKQINDKGYATKYDGSGKSIYLAAFAFLGRGDIELKIVKS